MSTLAELLHRVTDAEVRHELKEAYHRLDDINLEAHIQVLRKLRASGIEAQETDREEKLASIEVALVPARDDEPRSRPWHNVSGIGADSGVRYAIEFMRWQIWLGLPVTVKDCDLTPAQIVAHCLYEMTYCGFEQEEVQEHRDHVFAMAAEVKEALNNDHEDDGA